MCPSKEDPTRYVQVRGPLFAQIMFSGKKVATQNYAEYILDVITPNLNFNHSTLQTGITDFISLKVSRERFILSVKNRVYCKKLDLLLQLFISPKRRAYIFRVFLFTDYKLR